MSDTKITRLNGSVLRTPRGVARYAYVNNPDSSKMGRNRYKITIVFKHPNDDPEVGEFIKQVKELAKAHAKEIGVNFKDTQIPVKLVDEKMSKGKSEGKGTGDEVGLPYIKADSPSQYTRKNGERVDTEIILLDAGGKPADVQVYGGDLVRAEVRAIGWEMDGDHGVKLMLSAVKLLKSNWKGAAGSTLSGGDDEFLETGDQPDEIKEDDGGSLVSDESIEDDSEPEDGNLDTEDESDPLKGLV